VAYIPVNDALPNVPYSIDDFEPGERWRRMKSSAAISVARKFAWDLS